MIPALPVTAMVECLSEPTFLLNGCGTVLHRNAAAARLFPRAKGTDSGLTSLFPLSNPATIARWLRSCRQSRNHFSTALKRPLEESGEEETFIAEGFLLQPAAEAEKALLFVRIFPPHLRADTFLKLNAQVHSLNEKLRAAAIQERRLKLRARTDPLTGLMNKEAFLLAAKEEITAASKTSPGTWAALIMMDLDHFKSLNDRLGQLAGDRLLESIASRMIMGLRIGDHCGRFGGDEFIALLLSLDGKDEALEVAERLLKEIQGQPIKTPEGMVVPGASVGVAAFRPTITAAERLMDQVDRADHALYRAKKAGRNRVWMSDQPDFSRS